MLEKDKTFNSPLESIYTFHHVNNRGRGFCMEEQLRAHFLKREMGQHKRVLDIGCRDGYLTRHFVAENQVVGCDIDGGALEIAKSFGIEVKKVDLNDEWGFESSSFDVVVAAEVLEHLYFPELVIEKVKRVLTAEGMFLGSIPHAFSYQNRIRLLFGTKYRTPLRDPTHINNFFYFEFKDLLNTHFNEFKIIPVVNKKIRPFVAAFKTQFASMFLFWARRPKKDLKTKFFET